MRTLYDEQLRELRAGLADLCGLTETAITRATRALLGVDLTAAEHVDELNNQIAKGADDLDHRTFALIALQAPVAQDLRAVIAGLHNGDDMRRMGILAAHIAEVARLVHPEPALPDDIRAIFIEMAVEAQKQAAIACDVVRTRDIERAKELDRADDRMDALLLELFAATRSPDWPYGAASAVNVTLLGRFYERFCDHAVEIGRRVIFVVTGQLPE